MNILHHKSWHVRNKDNIERVRRDEAKAAEEDKRRQQRIALAEQEARTNLLRKKVKGKFVDDGAQASTSTIATVSDQPRTHINFFSAEQEQKQGTNKEYESEKREEKEQYEKKIGLLTYLGQSSVETQQSKPWYFKLRDKSDLQTNSKNKVEEYDLKRKRAHDPMRETSLYLESKKKRREVESKSSNKHKHKKCKDERPSSVSNKGTHKKTIQELREERLKREKAERKRAQEFIAKAKGEHIKEKEVITDERQRTYNSQFNPELARKSKHKY